MSLPESGLPVGVTNNAQPSNVVSTAAATPPVRASLATVAWRLRPTRFWTGLLCGVLLVFAARWAINRSPFADTLVAPLVRADTTGRADAIVVLGAGIVGHCIPNNNALRRATLAARLWQAGRAPVVVVTGGPPRGFDCPVATVMASVVRDLGVPADRIRMETASHSTHENAVETDALLKSLRARRLLIVTDRLHMTRAGGAFASLGYQIERASVPVYEGHPDNVSMLYAGLREYVALAYYRWQGWLAPLDAAAPARSERSQPGGLLLEPVRWRQDTASKAQMNIAHPQGPIVILGASYAAGWHPSIAGLVFVNRGVAGQQSFELLERFERDVLPPSPRAVIVWGFINDIFRAPRTDVGSSIARARTSFTQLVAAARARGIEPILATEVTIRGPNTWSETLGSWVGWATGKQPYQAAINAHVRDTNAWLRDLARREGLLLLEFERVVADENGERRRQFANDDGSHISAAGYAALEAYAAPVLAGHFKGR